MSAKTPLMRTMELIFSLALKGILGPLRRRRQPIPAWCRHGPTRSVRSIQDDGLQRRAYCTHAEQKRCGIPSKIRERFLWNVALIDLAGTAALYAGAYRVPSKIAGSKDC